MAVGDTGECGHRGGSGPTATWEVHDPQAAPSTVARSKIALGASRGDARQWLFQRIGALTAAAVRAIGDTIVPPVCLACQDRLTMHDCLCSACWAQVVFVCPPLCDRLGIPLPYDAGVATISAAAIANPPIYDRARAVAAFAGPVQRLIHGFKYSDRHDGRRLFGRWLSMAGADLLADADLVVPIPLNRRRLLERRFNQAAILSNEVGKLTGVRSAPMVLTRVKPTASQVGMTRDERQRNVAGAFAVSRGQLLNVVGRRIVLIDDVITTGATLNAAARTLKTAGAARVDALALAIVTHTVS